MTPRSEGVTPQADITPVETETDSRADTAAEQLADGADMWREGLDLPALLDDDGNLDPTKG